VTSSRSVAEREASATSLTIALEELEQKLAKLL
jgi:hypothetical protein